MSGLLEKCHNPNLILEKQHIIQRLMDRITYINHVSGLPSFLKGVRNNRNKCSFGYQFYTVLPLWNELTAGFNTKKHYNLD